jgi:hypothetical protein
MFHNMAEVTMGDLLYADKMNPGCHKQTDAFHFEYLLILIIVV